MVNQRSKVNLNIWKPWNPDSASPGARGEDIAKNSLGLNAPQGAFIHRQQQDICAVLLENKKKLVIGYFCDFVISELEEKENLL